MSEFQFFNIPDMVSKLLARFWKIIIVPQKQISLSSDFPVPLFLPLLQFFPSITSETIETSHASNVPSTESSTVILIGELLNIQAAYRLNGRNYLKWSQLVRTLLKGIGKLSHLLGTGPKKGDPNFETWDEQDSLLMSWLWNLMLPKISITCVFLGTAKEIWDTVKQTYS